MTKLIIQIPCLNEAATLPETIRDLSSVLADVDNIAAEILDFGDGRRDVQVVALTGEQGVDDHHGKVCSRCAVRSVDADLNQFTHTSHTHRPIRLLEGDELGVAGAEYLLPHLPESSIKPASTLYWSAIHSAWWPSVTKRRYPSRSRPCSTIPAP